MLRWKGTECHRPTDSWRNSFKKEPMSNWSSSNCALSGPGLINHRAQCGIDEWPGCSFTGINLWFSDCYSLIHTFLPPWSICMMDGRFSRATHVETQLYIHSLCVYELVPKTNSWQQGGGWGNIVSEEEGEIGDEAGRTPWENKTLKPEGPCSPWLVVHPLSP